jgi:predicted dinucleotide-binding enzyme
VYETRRRKRRPSLVYCGDDKKAKKIVARLIDELGFDPVDVGPLEMARHTEPFTMLVAKLAYEGDAGPAIAYRFEQYAERS